MKGTKQVWIMMAVIFGLAVLLPSVATSADKYVTFGQTEALTGPLAGFGVPNKRIVEMAIEKINNEGGFKVKGETYKLRVICEDNKNTTEGAIAANNKLIHQDQVKIVMNFPTTPAIASASCFHDASDHHGAPLRSRLALRMACHSLPLSADIPAANIGP
jgi:hypothetical protein